MDAPTDPTPTPAAPPAETPPSGDGATVDMSQVAGERPTALPGPTKKPKDKKEKKEMTAVASSDGAVSPADKALLELGTKRGIETLFRTSYRTNMDLTSLADAKANIMISINGLIVSILIASIAPGIEKNPWLLVPTSLFLVGCLGSLVFAVLAARPRVQSTVIPMDEALKKRSNLLFFGNFHHLAQAEYVFAMKEVVQDPTQIYEMMMKDVYGIGSVLQKKYRLLRKAYTIFIGALVLGVLSFIAVFSYASLREPGVPTVYSVPAETLPPGAAPGTGPAGILP